MEKVLLSVWINFLNFQIKHKFLIIHVFIHVDDLCMGSAKLGISFEIEMKTRGEKSLQTG